MDLKKIIEADNQKVASDEAVRKMQRNVIKEYEKVIELGQSLTNKLAINKSYRDEVQKFFIDNGFEKSDKDHEGHTFISDSTTYYKHQNTWIAVTFNEYSETEDIIQLRFPLDGKIYSLSYQLNDDTLKKFGLTRAFVIDNEFLHLGNYKEIIEKCDSMEKLSNLDNQLKGYIQCLQENLNKDINTDRVYQLPNKEQFKTFEEAFEAL